MSILNKVFPIGDDLRIPAVGFGTYLIDQADVAKAVRTAIGLGYRHIDTAAVYQNEEGVGEGIRAGMADNGLVREEIFVTTKLWPGAAAFGETAKSEKEAIAAGDESLAKLGLDHVDLYLIHSPHGGAARVDQWQGLVALKQAGKTRSIGVSNFAKVHIDEIIAAGLPMPEANQIELHPWSQKRELLTYMQQRKIAPIAYSSLAPLSTWRSAPGQDSAKSAALRAEDTVFASLAARYGVTEAQLLLRWGVQSGFAVLPKSLKAERMRENLDLGCFEISKDDMARFAQMDRGDGIAWSIGDPTKVD